ncbi:class I glutamine amidotransferase-like protein [Gonapodya prolifera JEL478]|uniref:Class I glutamine amidotransferase-like protein n=1 Tax=Gonapodya prolifera (strain JEL478) TaxID=1344416 RepID=A0A139AJ47_GONPJ|nr:class I glutamine amidotransferase-like protein [Gonapodya prolifera JEL478]|eukprot:KXS16759.1 class I glutamine amidotransferase-like protein [Gonapodya prolifera JEL478]
MVAASSPASSRPRADPTALVVVGVAYDGWEAESLLAPLSVIHRASNVAERSGKSTRARVLVAAEKKRACLSPQGCAIVPDATWSEVEKADIILVPGGFSAIIESSNPTLLDFLRRVSKNAKLVASVSSGAAILAKAGLLDKKSATTSKASFPTLAPNHPKTNWVPRARFIADDRLVTGAGVASAVDVAFEIVRTIWGSQIERSVASLVGGGGWRPANWDEDEFGRGVVKAGAYRVWAASPMAYMNEFVPRSHIHLHHVRHSGVHCPLPSSISIG